MKYKINKPIDGHKSGEEIKVESDEFGTPLQHSWRRRLNDAEFDQCCEVVEPVGILDLSSSDEPEKKASDKPKRSSKNKHQETEK
jgi:hypothetical protein